MQLRILATTALLSAIGFMLPVAATEMLGRESNVQSVLLAQSDWQAFTSEAGKFTVQMPGTPSSETSPPVELAGEPVSLHQVTVQNDDSAYVVVYADLPNSFVQQGSEKILDDVSQQLLTDMGLQQLRSNGKKIELDGNPGREFRASDSGQFFAMRLYLVGQRSYLLLSQSKASGDVNQFLSSFQLQ